MSFARSSARSERGSKPLSARSTKRADGVRRRRAGIWPGVAYRWITALAFALVSAFAVGAGYGWIAKPYAAELEAIRPQADLGLFVEHRMSTMTPTERRQLDALMKWKRAAR